MKKLLSILILPLVALGCLVGCGKDKKIEDIKSLYTQTVEVGVSDGRNDLFNDTTKPNSITLRYQESLKDIFAIANPSTDVYKRYSALKYQQLILNYIYNYYENNQEQFYIVMASKDVPSSDVNALYDSLVSLKDELKSFKSYYTDFYEMVDKGITDIMEFSVTNYTFQVNRVIDASFNFMYKFADMNEKYQVEDLSINNASNISILIDRAYLDIAYIAYHENIKSFNYTVGSRGICDLVDLCGNTDSYQLLNQLDKPNKISNLVVNNLTESATQYDTIITLLNQFRYCKAMFEQRKSTYFSMYEELDFYNVNQYRFGLVSGVDYNSYKNSMSRSDLSKLNMMNDFISNTYTNYLAKLKAIVEV